MIETRMLLVSALLFTATAYAQHDHHDDHSEEGIVTLEPSQMEALDLSVIALERGSLTDAHRFPAEVELDPMRVAHLTPRVEGIVREVHYRLGDRVSEGALLATLESRELGKAKSTYLAALAREALREKIHAREKRLWEKGISAEQDFLEAEQARVEARIATSLAREALFSLGVSRTELEALPDQAERVLNRYRMTMPFDGTIIEQHITFGEVLNPGSTAFIVADTRTVWIMARVSERDLRRIAIGQEGLAVFDGQPERTYRGNIDFIDARLDRETRTARVRLVAENPGERLRAGMFGRLTVLVPNASGEIGFLVPKTALQRTEDGHVVFRRLEPGRYQRLVVTLLAETDVLAEISGPLEPGEVVVTGDTFILESSAGGESLVGSHNH